MGYSTRNNGQIRDFWPDDTETSIYIVGERSLPELLELVKEKWGDDVDLDQISISADYIHTSCLTYDQYDSSDYTRFIVIERKAV